MKLFGEEIRNLRLERNLPLRKVAAFLDIDTSILSKIERGEREASREIVILSAKFFNLDEENLLKNYYSDQIAKIIYKEENCSSILKAAEQKIYYIKTQSLEQGKLDFDNE